MIRLIILLAASLSISSSLLSQNSSTMDWEWINTYGNDSNSVANGIVVDDDLNLYVSGKFKDSLIVENDTIVGQINNFSPFLSKWDQNGDLVWINNIEWGWAYEIKNLELDTNNNLYVLADQTQLLIYNGQNGSIITYYSLFSELPVAVQEYFFNFRMTSTNEIVLLSIDYSDIQNLKCNLTKCSLNNHYIDQVLWSKKIGLGDFTNSGVYDIVLDDADNIYIAGNTYGRELSIVSDSIHSTENFSSKNVFVCKFDPSGNALWLDTLNSNNSEIFNLGVNSTDSSLYFTGTHTTLEVWNQDTLAMNGLSNSQILLAKYSTSGEYKWAKTYPLYTATEKSTGPNGSMGTHVVVSDSGYVYLKGSFTGSIIFGLDTLYEDTTVVFYNQIADDVFLAKLDSVGNPIWGKYAGNGGGIGDQTGGFWVDETGEIVYMIGFDADQNNNKSVPTNSTKRIFIAREGAIDTAELSEFQKDEYPIYVYPNPSKGSYSVFQGNLTEVLTYRVINSSGQLMQQGVFESQSSELDLTNFPNGVYYIMCKYGTVKIVKE